MKSFFSIIYLPLKSNLQEKISIGLIMSDGERNIFRVSQPKLHILKNLITPHKYNLLKVYFKNINTEINRDITNYKLDIHEESSNWMTESYFSYLNSYSNNLVLYSEPRKIDLDVSTINFKEIFKKFIFEYKEEDNNLIKTENILSKVKTKLYSKIEDKVNLNVTIKSKDFNELLTPVDVNFIGENGVIVAGQTLDFIKRQYNLEHDLTSFISFTKAADYSRDDKGKFFIVGQEPNKKEHPKNHKTWKHVFNSHLVEYVDLNETEKIQDYIMSKGVVPFFEKE